jgi:hypothetical protein
MMDWMLQLVFDYGEYRTGRTLATSLRSWIEVDAGCGGINAG